MTAYAEVILHSKTLHAEMFLQTALGAVLRYYYGHPRSILRFRTNRELTGQLGVGSLVVNDDRVRTTGLVFDQGK